MYKRQTQTGVLSEGECEYRVPNTYLFMDTNAVNTCVLTTGTRVPESWLATGTRGRATGSAYIGYRDNGDMRRHWLKEKEQRVTLFLAW